MIEVKVLAWFAQVSQVAAASLVAGIWEGILLAMGVGLCLHFVPRMIASVRFLVWTIALVVLALLPFLHLGAGGSEQVIRPPVLQLGVGWSLAVLVLWAGLSLLRAGELVWQGYRLRTIWLRAEPVQGESGTGLLHTGRPHAFRKVQLCTSTDVDKPSVIGFVSPRILIPTWLMERVSRPELEQIVLHEMEHLKRGDDWVNLMQKLIVVAFPLNPVLLWVERRLCVEREMACDDGVLATTGSPRAYATCLTNLAEASLFRRTLSLSLGALEGRSELGRRVFRILRRDKGMPPWRQRVVMSGIVCGILCGAVGLARCPELVSFAGAAQTTTLHASPGYEPVPAYRAGDGAGVHATMVKAMVSTRSVGSAGAGRGRRVSPVHVTLRRKMRSSRAQTAGWLVLTSADVSVQPRMVLTIVHDQVSATSYAAVPTGAGWLVIQL